MDIPKEFKSGVYQMTQRFLFYKHIPCKENETTPSKIPVLRAKEMAQQLGSFATLARNMVVHNCL